MKIATKIATIAAVSINQTILKTSAMIISSKQTSTNRIPDVIKNLERLIRRLIFITTYNLKKTQVPIFITVKKIARR